METQDPSIPERMRVLETGQRVLEVEQRHTREEMARQEGRMFAFKAWTISLLGSGVAAVLYKIVKGL